MNYFNRFSAVGRLIGRKNRKIDNSKQEDSSSEDFENSSDQEMESIKDVLKETDNINDFSDQDNGGQSRIVH